MRVVQFCAEHLKPTGNKWRTSTLNTFVSFMLAALHYTSLQTAIIPFSLFFTRAVFAECALQRFHSPALCLHNCTRSREAARYTTPACCCCCSYTAGKNYIFSGSCCRLCPVEISALATFILQCVYKSTNKKTR